MGFLSVFCLTCFSNGQYRECGPLCFVKDLVLELCLNDCYREISSKKGPLKKKGPTCIGKDPNGIPGVIVVLLVKGSNQSRMDPICVLLHSSFNDCTRCFDVS